MPLVGKATPPITAAALLRKVRRLNELFLVFIGIDFSSVTASINRPRYALWPWNVALSNLTVPRCAYCAPCPKGMCGLSG